MGGADSILLRKWVADGDAEAFDELVRRHANMVYATSWRILRNRVEAEDVVQDCFLRLSDAARDIRTSLGGWLHAAAVNRSLDLIKRDSRRRERERHFAERQGNTHEMVWGDIEDFIDEAIAGLPDELRMPVVAHFLERQTHDAIAREIGIPRRTVSHRIGLGVEAIRKYLAERGIVAGSMALTAALSTHVAEGAPAALTASLGKIAMSGIHHAAAGGLKAASLSSGSLFAGKGVVAALVLVVAAGAWYLVHRSAADSEAAVSRLQIKPSAQSAPTAPAVPESAPATLIAPAQQVEDPVPTQSLVDPSLIEDPSQYITISGLVKDGTERPIAGARVLLVVAASQGRLGENFLREGYLQRSKTYETTSGGLGQYEISGIRHMGNAMLCAIVPGFAGNSLQFDIVPGKTYPDKDLDMTPGITIQGSLSAEDGAMVTDAVVSTVEAWNRKGYAWGWGFNVTDEHGLFTLSFVPDADFAHLRVNSESKGQDFFLRLPIKDGSFQLRMKPKASMHGTITWNGERPAGNATDNLLAADNTITWDGGRSENEVTVCLLGGVPEPEMSVMYTGMRREMEQSALVGLDGTYTLTGLYPGLEYRFFITKNEPGKHPSIREPLSPPEWTPLVFAPGEDREVNREIGRPLVVKGRLLTERSRLPVPGAMLQAEKVAPPPARQVGAAHVEQDGTFTFRSAAGPGTYTFTVMDLGPCTSEFREQLAKLPGAQLQLAAAEIRETEILVPEPALLSIRVIDHAGNPPANLQTKVHIVGQNGQNGEHWAYIKLDETGGHAFSIYEPIQEVWVEVGKGLGDGMPRTESVHLTVAPGETLPLLTVELEPTCTLTGIVRDEQGNKLANQSVTLNATYEDADPNCIQSSTDKDGRFECKDGFRTGVVTFSVRSDRGSWEGEPMECAPDDVIDLGEIVIAPQ
ncbi:MAG: sigma-70 family RNA polymerase sigma factor [Candidatus Hydrogenedentes bacterium]|nr:sigma-70 family RNA polymerase sigma factor [Candidatus Hydrogenedentota bacterium]